MTTLMVATFMSVLDGTIANVALPTIARELGTTPAASIWVVNGFAITVTATLFAFASLGGLIGYGRIYQIGIAIFTVGSGLCAISHSLEALVASRILQGLGSSMIMGIQPAIIRQIYGARRVGVGVGYAALTVATTYAAGPTIGGAILAIAPWPWLFLINVPIGVICVLMAARTVPMESGIGDWREFDFAGAAWAGVALSALILGVEAVAHFAQPLVLLSYVFAFVLALMLFVRRQRRAAKPLVSLDVFARSHFTLATLTSVLSYTAQGLALLSLPFFFQTALGRSAFDAGLLLTPWPVSVAILAPIAGRLADRYPVGILATIGLSTMALGAAALALLPPQPSVLDIVWREMICGLGFGFFQVPNNRELLTSVPPDRLGTAAGTLASARVFGQSLGAALVAVAFGILGAKTAARGGEHFGAVAAATPIALWATCAIASLGALVSALRLRSNLVAVPAPHREGA